MPSRLKILPKPRTRSPEPTELQFCLSPFLDGSPNELWEEGAYLFHCWMLDRFNVGAEYGCFEVAEALAVHRIVSDEWLSGLVRSGRLVETRRGIGPAHEPTYEAYGFRMSPLKPGEARVTVDIDFGDTRDYDPWTNRQHDMIDGARQCDLYVDNYYEVLNNEYYIFRRKPLVLVAGYEFVPVMLKDHPRYANTPEAQAVRSGDPPPIGWRDRVATAARGDRTFRRKRTG